MVLLGASVLAYIVTRTDSCGELASPAANGATMRAIRHHCYGPPDSLAYTNVPRPKPDANQVVVKVHAAGVNPLDWHTMRGSPYIMRLRSGLGSPEKQRFGVDFSGVVDSVGDDVENFKPGDRVFGGSTGAFAEYLVIGEDHALAPLPEGISHEQGASVAIAGVTAIQALRDKGQLKPGQKVLINGASGGVGTFAVQIARAMGAEVYGVCSTRNVDRVMALGAKRVFDYKKEDYTDSDIRFDLIVDMVGNHSPMANAGVLAPSGKLVMVGGPKGDWLGPLIPPLMAALAAPLVDQEMILLMARLNAADLQTLADMMAAGEVTSVIDKRFGLDEAAAALAYSETGRARGKIILQINQAEGR